MLRVVSEQSDARAHRDRKQRAFTEKNKKWGNGGVTRRHNMANITHNMVAMSR